MSCRDDGEAELASNAVGESFGTDHSTITIAAQVWSALVVQAGGHAAMIKTDGRVSVWTSVAICAEPRYVLSETRRAKPRAVDLAIRDASLLYAGRRSVRGTRSVLRAAASLCPFIGATLA